MSPINITDLHNLCAELSNAQLVNVTLAYAGESLRLNFTGVIGRGDINIRLSNIIHLTLSRLIDDDASYFVASVTIDLIGDGGKEVLTGLGYPFLDKRGIVISYPSRKLYQFQLEGAICLTVVCETVVIV